MTAADIARLDVPREELERELATLRAARARTLSESQRIAYANDEDLVAHPEWSSQAADYPGWAEHIAALAALNRKPQPRSTT
ncbi:hypothetical protein [Streptomyces indicus]|uniref:Uncharacterized protein n=1 Tax=Streptomyces indicus TaxID=417292 RepID=A0A1G9IVJ7_9ACTN|nr:hypothetical protein [Streptomyces indicus]SDL29075.1 hypothetical protein SAMN05421806_12586 [Streptomyces indicus]